MKMKKSLPLVMVFLLLVFNQSSSGILVRADLVDDTCEKTYNPVFCTSTLRSDPRSASADAKGLARIMLQVVQTNTNETYEKVNNLLANASDPVLKDMLTLCDLEYGNNVVSSCPDAIEKFDIGLYLLAQGDIDGVVGNAETCEKSFSCEAAFTNRYKIHIAFSSAPCQPRPSPLTNMNNLVYTLSRIAEDIIARYTSN